MKFVLVILIICLGSVSVADHVPAAQTDSPFERYQYDASMKRYADILKIADLIEDYMEITGSVPQLDSSVGEDSTDAPIFEVAVLGQPEAVDAVFRNGTPFGFSLRKFRPDVLLDVLERGLARPVDLPIDPQRVGTHFAPVYFVFFRRAFDGSLAHYIAMGTFAQPVARSTTVAEGVHIVAISNESVPFIVPVQSRVSFDEAFVSHVFTSGREADTQFMRHVQIQLE